MEDLKTVLIDTTSKIVIRMLRNETAAGDIYFGLYGDYADKHASDVIMSDDRLNNEAKALLIVDILKVGA